MKKLVVSIAFCLFFVFSCLVSAGERVHCFQDLDGDGFVPQTGDVFWAPRCPTGYIEESQVKYGNDCDDHSSVLNPGAEEICDGIDNDCDGIFNEGCRYRAEGEVCSTDIECETDYCTPYLFGQAECRWQCNPNSNFCPHGTECVWVKDSLQGRSYDEWACMPTSAE